MPVAQCLEAGALIAVVLVPAQNYLKLSLTQAKRLQMDSQVLGPAPGFLTCVVSPRLRSRPWSQVRVLQLETELLDEQERLRQLRKAQYQLAEQTGVSFLIPAVPQQVTHALPSRYQDPPWRRCRRQLLPILADMDRPTRIVISVKLRLATCVQLFSRKLTAADDGFKPFLRQAS